VVRGPDGKRAEHVVVLETLGAPERRRLRGRRARSAAPEPAPAAVTTARATVVWADPLAEDAAREWLSASGDRAGERVATAVRVLNRVLAAWRLAAADAVLREVSRDQALIARLGFGLGEEVADGRWIEAVEAPADGARRQRRVAALRPQERLAALLAGRDAPLACEELTMRARLDLDCGRAREAALQLRVALEAALAELAGERGVADLGARLDELAGFRSEVGEAANAALGGELPAAGAELVERVTARLEALLRARAAAG
jgi:hypothetical protein